MLEKTAPTPSNALKALLPLIWLFTATPADAWDDKGHVTVTRLAHQALPPALPQWLRTPAVRTRLEYLASEPDRWRGQHNNTLDHVNSPDHYIDEELLRPYGLSIKTLPPFEREFTDLMAARRTANPEDFKTYDRKRDRNYTRLSPGMLPYRIAELHWKITASWTTLKTYEAHRHLVTDDMIQNARQNIVFYMGLISHYVGDGAQPLHTTQHHNGWSGPNPKGYTTDRGFHRFIDGGILNQCGITPDSLLRRARPPATIPEADPWKALCAYLYETHQLAEPLYALEKSGGLYKAQGKEFIEDRLLTAGAMLAGLWAGAHDGAVIDDFRVRQLENRNHPRPATTQATPPD